MTTQNTVSWADANQAFLVGEFARLRAALAQGSAVPPQEATPPPAAANVSAPNPPPAINWLAEVFELTTFERDILLLCAGVEMDSRIAELCAGAQGEGQRAEATFGLAMSLLRDPHWSALTPGRPLRRFQLIEIDSGRGLSGAPLRINERILHFLAGLNNLDPILERTGKLMPPPLCIAEEHEAVANRILQLMQDLQHAPPIFHLCGDDAQGQEDTAGIIAHHAGRQLFILNSEDIPAPGLELEQLEILWRREALLISGAILLQCALAAPGPAVRRLAERLPGLVFLASRDPARLDRPMLRFDIDKTRPAGQRLLWRQALGPAAARANGTLEALAAQFRLSARTIFATGGLFATKNSPVQPGDLWDTCRQLSRPRLDDLAQRIPPTATWDDLVLPESRKETLRHIAAQVRHRMQVYDAWGFAGRGARGLGVSALFTGESGTGKTMAAEVLAHELNLDLYRIDLSAVVSKYIGETEKNLKQVFDAAEEGGVILLFDEADALFGKRSDVKDSHDRFANIEVSYLLQRMEAYQGLAILTTNLKSSMDRAFQRRIRFTVNFPFPDAGQRELIWARIFPAQTPTRGLDPARLAQLNVAGGNIRNIALNAAFLAAGEGADAAVRMEHLLQAARLESEKIERAISEAETRGWI